MFHTFMHARTAVVDARIEAQEKGDRVAELGLTLIETLLAIGVGALVIIAAVTFYMQATSGTRVSQSMQQLQAIISGVHGLYSTQSSYANIGVTTLQKANVFPPEMVDSSTNPPGIFDPWHGTVQVASANGNANFTIVFNSVPQDACIALLSGATSYGSGIVSVQGTSGGAISAGTAVTPDTAAGACTDQQLNIVTYTVR